MMIRSQRLCRRAHTVSPRNWRVSKPHSLAPVQITMFQQLPFIFTPQQGNIGLIQLRYKHDDYLTRISNATKVPKPIGLDSETSGSEASTQTVRSLPPPTAEQKKIIDHYTNEESNIIITACPGAGKTSTIIYLALAHPEEKIRFLTYNSQLAKETEERCKSYDITNVTISTIHAAGYNHYSIECRVDQGLIRMIAEDRAPLEDTPIGEFGTLIIDEAQDLTPILFEFNRKFLRDYENVRLSFPGTKTPRMIFLGDTRQMLYKFKNASAKFLTLTDHPALLGKTNSYKWVHFSMNTSKRLTPPMTDFINECLLDSTQTDWKIFSGRDPMNNQFQRPVYLKVHEWVEFCRFLVDKIKRESIPPETILILAPSVRYNKAVVMIVNYLAKHRIPVSVPDSDYPEFNHQVAKGKVLATTYHQSKGLERKIVFVLGFDANRARFYQDDSAERITNSLLVAVTRASEQLYVVADGNAELFKWISPAKLETYCDIQELGTRSTGPAKSWKRILKPLDVQYILNYMPDRILKECFSHLRLELVSPAGLASFRKSVICDTYGLTESVAPITGIAAASFFQIRTRRTFNMLRIVKRKLDQKHLSVKHNASRDKILTIHEKWSTERKMSTEDVLFVAALYEAFNGNFHHKLVSIPENGYNWMTDKEAADISDTIREHIKTNCGHIEKLRNADIPIESLRLTGNNGGHLKSISLSGKPDIFIPQERRIVELKHTEILKPEDFLEMVLYATIELHQDSQSSNASDEPWTLEVLSTLTGMLVRVIPLGNFRETCLKITQLMIKHYSKQFPQTPEPMELDSLSKDEFLDQVNRGFKEWLGEPVVPSWLYERPEKTKWELRDERDRLIKPGRKTPKAG